MNAASKRPNTLAVVVPCFNEQEILESSASVLEACLAELVAKGKVSTKSFVAFVDDGSTDATWRNIERLSAATMQDDGPRVRGLKLSRNCGHQNALLAGLLTFKGEADMFITIDADLQDDVAAIENMVDEYLAGAEIVYGVRNSRAKDTFVKRTTARAFYRFMGMLGVKTLYDHADFRLASHSAIEALAEYGETDPFLRGIFPLIGLRTAIVYYARKERTAGTVKYTYFKLFLLALDGITSFSIKPLRIMSALGAFIFIASIGAGAYALWGYVFTGVVKGWTSLALPMYTLGGIQLLGIGILGEYIGRIFNETKHRPRFIVETKL